MQEYLAFFVRFTPFWATPVCFIATEFGYKFWLKGRKGIYRVCFSLSVFCGLMNLFYFFVGGPENTARIVLEYVRDE